MTPSKKEKLKKLYDAVKSLDSIIPRTLTEMVVHDELESVQKTARKNALVREVVTLSNRFKKLSEDINVKSINETIGRISSEIEETKFISQNSLKELRESFSAAITVLTADIQALPKTNTLLAEERIITDQKLTDLTERIETKLETKLPPLFAEIKYVSDEIDSVKKTLEATDETVQKSFKEYQERINRVENHAGHANRNIQVNGSNVLSKYTDMNLIGTITTANNETNKMVDVTFSGGGNSSPDIIVASSGGDYTTIQDALDAVGSGGGTIFVKAGTYTITTSLLIKRSRTRLILSGGAIVQGDGASVSPFIKANTTGLAGVSIEGGKWLQTNATAQGTCLDASDFANSLFTPIRIEEFGKGILLNDTSNGTFYNNFKDTQIFNCNTCIEIGVDAASTQPNDNQFYSIRCRPKAGGAGYGVRIADARGLSFYGCDFEPSSGTGITGVSLEVNATSLGVSREIAFYSCWIEGNATNVSIASGCLRNSFYSCTITAPVTTNISDSGTNTIFLNTNNNAALLNNLAVLSVTDEAYGAGWNGSLEVPTKNAVYDKIETIGGSGATTALDNLASVAINAALVLGTSDAFALGSTTKQWSDLFLAEGGVINWDNGDATLTQVGNVLTLAGADFVADNVTVNTALLPDANDGAALGSATLSFADLFLANEAVINYNNGAMLVKHVDHPTVDYVAFGLDSAAWKTRLWANGVLGNNIYATYPFEFDTKTSGIYGRLGIQFCCAQAPENSQVGSGFFCKDDQSEIGMYDYIGTSTFGVYLGSITVPKLKVDVNNFTTSVIGSRSTKRAGVGGKIKDFFTDVGNVGTGEDDLYTYTTEASILGANGDSIEAVYGGVFVSSATATRQIRMYFGGTAIFDSGALTLSLSSAWNISVSITRVSSSVVRSTVSMTTEGAALAAYTQYTEVTGLTLSNTNILKITGEAAGVGAATDDIVAKVATVSWWPAAI